MTSAQRPRSVEIEHNGKKYPGSYTVTGGRVPMITVSALHADVVGTKTTQIGGMPGESLARLLLHELVNEAAKGYLKP